VPAEFATVPDSLLPYAIRFSSCQIQKQNTAGHALTCHFVLFCKASKGSSQSIMLFKQKHQTLARIYFKLANAL
jgi:ABC-type transporter Mla MlaB component